MLLVDGSAPQPEQMAPPGLPASPGCALIAPLWPTPPAAPGAPRPAEICEFWIFRLSPESMTATPKVRDALATGADSALIERLMSEGDYHGMATFDQALFQLFSEDLVTLDEALDRAAHPEDFRIAVQQAGLTSLR